MKQIYVTKKEILIGIIFYAGVLYQSGMLGGYYLTAILISTFFAGIGALNYFYKNSLRRCDDLIRDLLLPWILMTTYNIFLYIVGIGTKSLIKSSIVQSMFPPILIAGGYGIYLYLGGRSVKSLENILIFSNVPVLLNQLVKYGPNSMFGDLRNIFNGLSIESLLEKNYDVLYALGLYLIFYASRFNIKRKHDRLHIMLLTIIVMLGGKRSEYLPLILLCAFAFVSRRMSEKRLYKFEMIISCCLIASLIFYVAITISGALQLFCHEHGINTMGRLQMWNYVAQFGEISPRFLGKGYSFSTLNLENNRIWVSNGAVWSLHGSILAMYVDMGVYMFLFWLVFNLYIIPGKLKKIYGVKIMSLYWSFSVYLFILYITESAIKHFVTQTIFVVLILACVKAEEDKKIIKG